MGPSARRHAPALARQSEKSVACRARPALSDLLLQADIARKKVDEGAHARRERAAAAEIHSVNILAIAGIVAARARARDAPHRCRDLRETAQAAPAPRRPRREAGPPRRRSRARSKVATSSRPLPHRGTASPRGCARRSSLCLDDGQDRRERAARREGRDRRARRRRPCGSCRACARRGSTPATARRGWRRRRAPPSGRPPRPSSVMSSVHPGMLAAGSAGPAARHAAAERDVAVHPQTAARRGARRRLALGLVHIGEDAHVRDRRRPALPRA